jgi:sensor c-di-GMP phosphodiesterase-like protein
MIKIILAFPGLTLILIFKFLISLFIFYALMNLFIIILKTEIIGEKSFSIKFFIALPLAILFSLIVIILFFRFETSYPKIKRTKPEQKLIISDPLTKVIEP